MRKEAAHGHTVEGQSDANEDVDTITRLVRQYPWWTQKNEEDAKRKTKKEGVILV
jgi:hypothetical protein